jgi:hypothetical protein
VKIAKCRLSINEIVQARMSSFTTSCAFKIKFLVSKSLNKAILEMQFDGEIKQFSALFIQNNILSKGMSVSVQNYKVISFSDVRF